MGKNSQVVKRCMDMGSRSVEFIMGVQKMYLRRKGDERIRGGTKLQLLDKADREGGLLLRLPVIIRSDEECGVKNPTV